MLRVEFVGLPHRTLACVSCLLSLLPGVEEVDVRARGVSDTAEDLASLLNALASGPRLEALKVSFSGGGQSHPLR